MHLPRVMNVKRITTSWDRKSLSLTQLSGNHLFWVKNGPSTKCWRLMSYLGKDPLIIDCRYFHLHITNTSVLLGQISVAITFKRFSFFVSVQLSLWAVNRKHCTLNCLMLIIVTLLIFLKLDWALGYSCHGPILVSWPHTTSVPFSFPCPVFLSSPHALHLVFSPAWRHGLQSVLLGHLLHITSSNASILKDRVIHSTFSRLSSFMCGSIMLFLLHDVLLHMCVPVNLVLLLCSWLAGGSQLSVIRQLWTAFYVKPSFLNTYAPACSPSLAC